MKQETCANCGHHKDMHYDGFTLIKKKPKHSWSYCREDNCKCKKFIPNNNSPQDERRADAKAHISFSPSTEDKEPEENNSEKNHLVITSGLDNENQKQDSSNWGIPKFKSGSDNQETLGDKIIPNAFYYEETGLKTKDVKEAVKKLKELTISLEEGVGIAVGFPVTKTFNRFKSEIDKIFGKELI